MNTGKFTVSAVVATLALMTLAAGPAKAHDGVLDVALQLGPAYVRYHDGYYRADRAYRDVRYHEHHNVVHHRRVAQRDLWHRCNDGRWFRYHDRKHWKKHQKRRYKQRNHRRGHRH